MSVDLSNTNTKILKADFKDIINRVNKYITQGGEDSKGKISDDRNIYIDYPSNTKHIKYKTYKILKTKKSLNFKLFYFIMKKQKY